MKIQEDQIPDLIRKGRDKEVVPILYKKVLPLVEQFTIKNGGRKDDAFDVFQDALMVFYKQVIKNTFDPKYKVYGYLYRLSLNLWINKVKKDKRLQLVGDFEEKEEYDFNESNKIAEIGDENILKNLFSGIGEKCIELLTYTIYYNLLMEDIMLRMEFPSVSAVKMQTQRCKQKLMKEIENNPDLMVKLKKL